MEGGGKGVRLEMTSRTVPIKSPGDAAALQILSTKLGFYLEFRQP